MFTLDSNQILLLSCLVLLAGAGTYLTYFRQQKTLSTLDQNIEAKKAEKKKSAPFRPILKMRSRGSGPPASDGALSTRRCPRRFPPRTSSPI